jgi:hypothetical protein
MLLQQLPHWQHLHAMAAASPGTWRMVYGHARYSIVLAATMKYLPENRRENRRTWKQRKYNSKVGCEG